MKSLFAKLPKVGQVRFATAPETYSHITRMHSEPVDVIVYLCNALNGEAAFRGLGEVKEGYSTALGDMYVIANPEASQSTFDKLEIIRARYLSGGITVDFGSPNTVGVQESKIKREYGTYSPDEEAIVFDRLEATLQAIEAVSSVAAQLIRSFVKVIIPLKTAAGRSSTSQPRIPGRVLIGGTERGSLAPHASSLVHEAMHQLLYTLEFGGTFITPHLDAGEARATSLWTGRDLPLHSFIHACFIWYGLSQFWGRPKAAEVFGSAFTEREFARCTAGYRNKNPVEMLLPNLGMVRYDVFKVANTLRDNLASVLTHGYHVQA
ncbi:HEXXH motif-containing putative peptide modification protein [Granulicella sp. dw_53]|uniref:aKG-HExxH-type peptide beta-hydroxylase n=1 Tax=Granulicella sp. dw_53 TaxID=2719792 RepID=UPI001BD3F5CB|nr:HEXXH motif-containing putative peptide modification protein [Granulicella sp. dw_53]